MRRLVVITVTAACGLFPDASGLGGNDAGQDATMGSEAGPDAPVDVGAADVEAAVDAPSCTCTGLVSAYRFTDPTSLGHDYVGNNNMTDVKGSPKQSTTTPTGLGGYSIQLDGSSSVCIDVGFTFDSTSDHTLCWWSQPSTLANQTNQFAQTCSYDTWTQSSGVDYLWRLNNCNGGTTADFVVPGVYAMGQWTQVCQTYTKATKTRTVVINGQTSKKSTLVDTVALIENGSPWCIGSYGSGGWWTGLIYLPLWFNRVLSDAEIQQVYAKACCLP